ncbi:MAG: hypothetical protein CEE43_04465 [Promethearchaeota archaeon Loki_b32]|nr:MAG: hypothetical protein CEE43_04465 [Candidatus Lokiarchaeota archaeon Loki_b32]
MYKYKGKAQSYLLSFYLNFKWVKMFEVGVFTDPLEEKFKLITENVNELISIVNKDYIIEFINMVPHLNVLGYNEEDLKGKSWLKLVHPKDLKKVKNNLKLDSEHMHLIREIRLIDKKGNFKKFKFDVRAFVDNSNTNKFIIILSNITKLIDKRETEQQLKESEEKFRTITEQSLMGIIILQNSKIQYINKTAAHMVDYTPNEILNFPSRGYINLIYHADRKMVIKQAKKRQRGIKTKITGYECRCLKKNGDLIWLQIYSKTITYHGKFADLITVIDITDKKKAEIKSKESEQTLRYLLSSNPIVIYTSRITEVRVFTFVSENVRDMTGYSPEDFIKKSHFWNLKIHPEDKDRIQSQLRNLSKKDNLGLEYRFRFKDGIYHWIQDEFKIVKDKKGLLLETIGSWVDVSVNKNIEEKVKFQAKLVETISDAIISTDLKFNIITWNKAAESIYGWKAEEVKRKNISDVIPIEYPYDDQDIVLKEFFEIGKWKGEVIQPRKNGNLINILTSISMIKGNNGKPIGVVAINRNITERKKAEQELKESEMKYRDLFENSPIALFEQDFSELKTYLDDLRASGVSDFEKYLDENPEEIMNFTSMIKLIDINRKTVELYNVNSKDDFIKWKCKIEKRLFQEDMTPEVLLTNKQELLSLIHGETTFESEVVTKTFTGEKIYVYMKTLIIPGYEKTWSKVIVSLLNISDRIKTELKLKESEEKFRTIAEQSSLGMIIQQDGFIKFANSAVSDIIEYPLEEIHKWTAEETLQFVYKEDLPLIIDKLKQRQEGDFESINQYECRAITKSGKIKWINVYTKPIIYQGKNAVLSTFIDITEKKKVEEELKDVSRLKSDLISRTSHELKTPLVSIKGYADLLLSQHYEELDFYTISVLHEIKQGCYRLESLIKDLLETSELETGEVELNKLKDDLAFLIRFCVKDLKGLIETRKHNLILDIPENLVTLFEKERIYEVVINLLSNAIKYTPPNGRIIINSESKDNNYIVSIKDNGIDLTDEEKEKIFKKFGKIERYGKGLDVVSEGSGLGLYISMKIIELHGGHIWVESKGRDKGATFSFSLPILSE